MSVEIIGFLIIIAVMVFVIVRRQIRKNALAGQKNLDDSANQLQFQLEEVADTVIQRVEKEINQLEQLLQRADQKISQIDERINYVQEMISTQALSAKPAELMKTAVAHEQAVIVPAAPADEIVSVALPKKRKIEIKSSKINSQVMEMLDAGHTLDEIAKQAQLGKGAVLLIQEMYKMQKLAEKI